MRLQTIKKSFTSKIWMAAVAMLVSTGVFAQPPKPSVLHNSLALTLLIIAVSLLLAIGLLAYVLIGAAQVYLERQKQEKTKAYIAAKSLLTVIMLLFSTIAFSQQATGADAVQVAVSSTIGGLSATTFYILVGVIALEILVLLVMLQFVKVFVMKEKPEAVSVSLLPTESRLKKWWMEINKFKPLREEQDIMLDHNYDGIKELDNRLPPWWLYGFYLSIIFAGVYLFRYHVAHSAPLPAEELAMSIVKADAAKEEYLKNAANNVDENTVTLMVSADDLASGKGLFITTCAACHGNDGQGMVGPNLTDDYWLHKGGVKDIFKTIKYGVPEKGMKSWKDDFSPVQIAQLTSYIKSIHGTNPPSPKEPQGDLYKEETGVGADTSRATLQADTIMEKQ